jgi:hypothetical protein
MSNSHSPIRKNIIPVGRLSPLANQLAVIYSSRFLREFLRLQLPRPPNDARRGEKKNCDGTATTTVATNNAGSDLLVAEKAGAETNHDANYDNDNSEMLPSLSSSSLLLDNVHGLIALSGPVDLNAMRATFHKFGFDRNYIERIFVCGRQRSNHSNDDLAAYDPMLLLDRIDHNATKDDTDDDRPDCCTFRPCVSTTARPSTPCPSK